MKPSDWPRLPPTIYGLAGPIRIHRPVMLPGDDLGLWEAEHRRIRVKATVSREVAWAVLLHELTHTALYDSGLTVGTEDDEERLCDTMASAMMHVIRWHLEKA
jgi:hypothetical protein